MTIGGTDYGYRATPTGQVLEQPRRWTSAGISLAGDVIAYDYGVNEQGVPITFVGLTTSQKDTMKSYLMNTIKPYGTCSVTPDSGDDLGIGATGATNLIFVSFEAVYMAVNLWQINIVFNYYN
jgi:hypothetical protein